MRQPQGDNLPLPRQDPREKQWHPVVLQNQLAPAAAAIIVAAATG
ncbi:hypothetical protein ACFPVT_09060 [Corynebacterium choanae]|nr:hypothetical protein [Corynebacterium choanae]